MSTPIPSNDAPFTLRELLAATGGQLLGGVEVARTMVGVATDTRADLTGKIFVALHGERFDAHEYLQQAIDSGAAALVVDRASSHARKAAIDTSIAVIGVDDTLLALGDLALFHRRRWGGSLCAVVGSAGKTTTRGVISALLQECRPGEVHSTSGNLNNRIGVPMVLLGLEPQHSFAVVELGTNQAGEVAHLGRISQPNLAVLTLVDLEHTEGLGDLDGVEREEASVFAHLQADGIKIGFGEDARVLRSLQGSPDARVITYGFEEGRDVRIVSRRLVSELRGHIGLSLHGRTLEFETSLIGRPGALAAAAGVSVVDALLGEELDEAACARALATVEQPGRNQARPLPEGRVVVDDSYNSNPASVVSSIATGEELARLSGGRLWLVLGEMLELGSLSEEAHRKMGRDARASSASGLFFIQGDARWAAEECREGSKPTEFFESTKGVAERLGTLMKPGDVAVVKASRGVRAERVVEGLADFFRAHSQSLEKASSVEPGASSS